MTSAATTETASPTHPTLVADPADDRAPASPARPFGGSLVPAAIRRRLAPFEARLDGRSWLAAGVVTLIAAILRLVDLHHPQGKIFDETYYAKDAYGLITKGIEWNYKDDAPSYVVHPPLGKWLIGLGEWAFGYQDADGNITAAGHLTTTSPEFGWRIAAALAGIGSVLMIVRIGRRLFHSTVLGCVAGLLMAMDGLHLVLSRSALLDVFLMFFILAAFGALVLDRDSRRGRWLRALENGLDTSVRGPASRPRLGVPWWRLLAAVLIGCAIAVKWSAFFFLPAFLLLVVLWDIGARRSAGVRKPIVDTVLDETGWLMVCAVLVGAVYLASWSGWFLTDDGFYRHYLESSGRSELPVVGALQNLMHYHSEVLKFHSTLDDRHTYQSWPWQWLLLGRPVAFYWSTAGDCGASKCAAEVLLLGTPVLWWSFLPALAVMTWFGIARRDWRALAIGLMVVAGFLPWFYYALDGRVMFAFYALPAEPFLILAVVYVLGAIMAPARGAPPGAFDRRLLGAVVAAVYVLLVAACFAYFYPVYVGELISYRDWAARMWLGGRWI